MVATSELAAALGAVFEGDRTTAYQDSGGVWTIGIGHTGPDVHQGLTWTHQQSMDAFARDEAALFGLVTARPILEAAALIDFGYNCGAGNLRKALAGDVLAEIAQPVHTTDRHGTVLPGLVARRRLELLLIQVSRQGISPSPAATTAREKQNNGEGLTKQGQ